MNNYKTIGESIQESIIEADAIERKAKVGFIFVDLTDEKKVTAAYFEDREGNIQTLNPSSKLQVVTSNEDGIQYYDVSGQDIFERKNDMGNPLFAGMTALLLP